MGKNYNNIVKGLAVVVVLGLVAYIYQLYSGLIVTNMRNPFSWGLYVYEGEPPDLLSVELDFLSMTNDSAFLNRLKEWIYEFTERVKRH